MMPKGHKHTPEAKIKMSLAARGKPKTEGQKRKMSLSKLGNKNPNWKDNVGIEAIHDWIKRRLSKTQFCQSCNKVPPYDLANKSGKYLRDLDDWQWLCRRCHMLSDGRMNNLFHNKRV